MTASGGTLPSINNCYFALERLSLIGEVITLVQFARGNLSNLQAPSRGFQDFLPQLLLLLLLLLSELCRVIQGEGSAVPNGSQSFGRRRYLRRWQPPQLFLQEGRASKSMAAQSHMAETIWNCMTSDHFFPNMLSHIFLNKRLVQEDLSLSLVAF